jgi:hypothetical protein
MISMGGKSISQVQSPTAGLALQQ